MPENKANETGRKAESEAKHDVKHYTKACIKLWPESALLCIFPSLEPIKNIFH